MADRSSAEAFGFFFTILAQDPDARAKRQAHQVYKKSSHFDFTADQMDCDDALVKLGLARRVQKMSGSYCEYLHDDYEAADD